MEISIFQIKQGSEYDPLRFESYDIAKERGLKASCYEKIYGEDVDAETLDDVFYIFNQNRPIGFIGHSLSISDIVEVQNNELYDNGFYYVDSFGFEKIDDFNVEETDRENIISVLICENERRPYRAEIPNKLKAFQNIVDGHIDMLHIENDIYIYFNEEFLFNGSLPNRKIGDTTINGAFVVFREEVGCETSLSEEQMKKYARKFWSCFFPTEKENHYVYI